MRKKCIFLVILVLFSSTFVWAGDTPRSTVLTFLNALRWGNVELFKKCIHGGDNIKGDADAAGLVAMKMLANGSTIVDEERVSYNHYIVYVKFVHPLTDESGVYPIPVKRYNGDWKIGK